MDKHLQEALGKVQRKKWYQEWQFYAVSFIWLLFLLAYAFA